MSYHARATKMRVGGAAAEDYIAMQSLAVDELRRGEAKESAVEILSQMGYFYSRSGDYLNGMEYLHEAMDSLYNMPRDSIDPVVACKLIQNQANLYQRVGLLEDALRLNAEAIALSRANGEVALPDLLRMRAFHLSDYRMPDSALIYHDMACRVALAHPEWELYDMYVPLTQMERAAFMIENNEHFPDSVANAIALIEEYGPKCGRLMYGPEAQRGRGYILGGQTAKGLAIIDKTLDHVRGLGSEEDLEWMLGVAAKAYARTGRYERLAEIYDEYITLHDTISRRLRNNALIGMDFRYRLKENEREAEKLRTCHRYSRRMIVYQVIAIVSLLILLYVMVKRHRRNIKNEKERSASELNRMKETQVTLNSTIETLSNQITQIESVKVVEEVSRQLSPKLLSGQSEQEFRRAFASLYPRFLPTLRREYPALTPGDELICMLIYLRHNNEEIALCLGIARSSVNTARHRLRKKLALDKETDLDTFILTRN